MSADHSLYSDKSAVYFDNARQEIAPLVPNNTDRVLEIGCGTGATMKWLRNVRPVRYAVGIELFPEAAELAATAFDAVLTGSIESMDLPEGKFDLVIALDVLEHLVDPWRTLGRLHAILNENGALVVSLPNIGHYSVSVPLLLRGRFDYGDEGLLDRTHLRFFTTKTAIDLLTRSGLTVDKVKYVCRGPQIPSARARWFVLKFLTWILPMHLIGWQILIRLRATTPASKES